MSNATPTFLAQTRRRTTVSGRDHLLHAVSAANPARTLCGRLCCTVNHTYDLTAREELCVACSASKKAAVTR